jgi:hypothetical protein
MGERFSTGVEGLDGILTGGLPRDCMYLVQGPPLKEFQGVLGGAPVFRGSSKQMMKSAAK